MTIEETNVWSLPEDKRREAFHRRAQEESRRILDEIEHQRHQQRIDASQARTDALNEPSTPFEPVGGTLKQIMTAIARHREVSPDEIKGRSRKSDIVRVRHEVFYWTRMKTKLSYPQIGMKLNRDHSSVLWGAHKFALRNGLPPPPQEERS